MSSSFVVFELGSNNDTLSWNCFGVSDGGSEGYARMEIQIASAPSSSALVGEIRIRFGY